MCFKLDNGSELFSIQEMHRLRKQSSGVMGSRSWAGREGVRPMERPDGATDPCPREAEGDDR
jgi:hypothetical protein